MKTRKLSLTHAGEQLYQTAESLHSIRSIRVWRPWHTIVRRRPARCVLMPASTLSVPVELVADDLERETLIRVLQRYSLRMDGLHLYYPHRNVSPALRAVIDTLKI